MTSIAHAILHLSGPLALVLIFALPALEASVFLGFVFPGEDAAILGGVLSFEHRISLGSAVAAVVIGAILGDSAGYAVGRRWGVGLLEGPLARWVKPVHVGRARALMKRRGAWAVVIGRWSVALRVLVAGIAEMPYRSFLLFNVIGGAAWGTTMVLVGYAAGASWRSVSHTLGSVGLGLTLGIVVAVLVAIIAARRRRSRDPVVEQPD